MFCSKCGKEVNDEAVICIHCGCAINNDVAKNNTSDAHEWIVTMLLCWFLGGFGAHRFYTGHIASGIVQLITLGGCGIWALIDWICLCANEFKDINNKPLKNYNRSLGIALFCIGLFITFLAILVIITAGE